MLGKSKEVLKQGYIIYLSKKPEENLSGTYQKSFPDGIRIADLSDEELSPLFQLTNIVEILEQGNILQVHQSGYLIKGIIGEKKTEGPYCQTEYLKVTCRQDAYSYYDMLTSLDMKLDKRKENKLENRMQYKKLYRGVDRYE